MMKFCNNNLLTSINPFLITDVNFMAKLLVLLLILFLPACGMQGDLYLPDEQADKQADKVATHS